jgi:hypothetical protein
LRVRHAGSTQSALFNTNGSHQPKHCAPIQQWLGFRCHAKVAWILAPVNGDDLPGLELQAGLQQELGCGVAQPSMNALASGSAAM